MEPRKINILRAITDDYISTAEPVGSRTVARKYDLGVSPATIRNEMSDLEEQGYLEQPHTSSGRIPSDKGYRFYVDELMHASALSQEQMDDARERMTSRQPRIEAVIHRTARLLSRLSHYTAVVKVPQVSEATIRSVHLAPFGSRSFLMVIVTNLGFVRNQIVDSPVPVTDELLAGLGTRLNSLLIGKSLREITRSFLAELRASLIWEKLFAETVDRVVSILGDDESEPVFVDGALHLFNQPEFQDVDRARTLLAFLEEPGSLDGLLSDVAAARSVRVTIGKEHSKVEMQECSTVTATYSIGGVVVGTIGVVGPTRLDYGKVVGVVQGMAEALSEALTQLSRRK